MTEHCRPSYIWCKGGSRLPCDVILPPACIFAGNMVLDKTVALHTLGCKLNYSESSSLTRLLQLEGFQKKEFDEPADVYVINTCSVTANADKECRQLVRRIQRRTPSSLIVITGCYAQLKPEEIARIPGVDLVLGAGEKFNIAEHLKTLTKGVGGKICSCDIESVTEFNSAFSQNDRTRSFLKIQDGCDYHCSFCTIPTARGKSRSDSMANVIKNVNQLAENGIKEIVLTGVNLGDFRDPILGGNFYQMIQELDKIDGIDRYRISSIEPNLLTDEIIRFVAKSHKFMPHFHIPLQSGCNQILRLMRRRYQREFYEDRVHLIKSLMPHCAIGVDVIVGFPGEQEEYFKETQLFLENLDISYLHVFSYSERDNTKALEIKPVVPIQVRQERNKTMRNLSFRKMQDFTKQNAGQTRKVLFEYPSKNGMMDGYTDNYIKITTPGRKEWINHLVDWAL